MGEVVKLYTKAFREKIEEFGGDAKDAIRKMQETESIWDLPIEERQAAYDALRAKYGSASLCMSGPGVTNDFSDDDEDEDGEL